MCLSSQPLRRLSLVITPHLKIAADTRTGECVTVTYLHCSRGRWRVQNLPLLPGADGCQSCQVGLPLSHLSQLLLLHLHTHTHTHRQGGSTLQPLKPSAPRLIVPPLLSASDAAALGPLVELETATKKKNIDMLMTDAGQRPNTRMCQGGVKNIE